MRLVSASTKRVGTGGFGTLGSLVPAESFFFDDVVSPTKVYRGEITRFPSGRLFAFNNGTFTYEGDDSSFDYTVFEDGVAIGSFTVELGDVESGAIVNFSMPQFSVSATASTAAPATDATVAFTMPHFSVAVSAETESPTSGATISFAMPQFTVAVNAESTIPEISATVAFTMPQFTVQVFSGEFDYYNGVGTTITYIAESTEITYNP
jgi:hypothetical protein